jgi:hypothetical protein
MHWRPWAPIASTMPPPHCSPSSATGGTVDVTRATAAAARALQRRLCNAIDLCNKTNSREMK